MGGEVVLGIHLAISPIPWTMGPRSKKGSYRQQRGVGRGGVSPGKSLKRWMEMDENVAKAQLETRGLPVLLHPAMLNVLR
jgi:hypothetical protein